MKALITATTDTSLSYSRAFDRANDAINLVIPECCSVSSLCHSFAVEVWGDVSESTIDAIADVLCDPSYSGCSDVIVTKN